MYKWLVTVGMKNGQILKCLWKSEKSSSMDVAKEIIPEKMPSNFITTALSESEESQILFRVEDVSTLEIKPFGEEAKE